jgi:hypothetical protein
VTTSGSSLIGWLVGVTLLLSLVLLTDGCSREADEPNDGLVDRGSAPAAAVRIRGASARQAMALRSVLAGMGKTRITRVDFEDARAHWSRPGVSLILSARRANDQRAEWEQGLAAAVFRDRAYARKLPPVIAASSKQMHGGSSIAGKPDPAFRPYLRRDSDQVAQRIRDAARANGSEVDQLVLLQPDGLAPFIRLRVEDPARFLAERWHPFLVALEDDMGRYEGHFIELSGSNGRPVARFFGVTRSHWGGSWHQERLSGCAIFSLGTPIGYSPPRCPVEE